MRRGSSRRQEKPHGWAPQAGVRADHRRCTMEGGQTSRARPAPSPTPGDITNPSGRPSNHTHMPLPILLKGASQAGWAQDSSLKLPVRAKGRLWPRSPGQQRKMWNFNAEDGSPLNGFASRGGQGSSDENQGPGTLVSAAVDPHERSEIPCPLWLGWGHQGSVCPSPFPWTHIQAGVTRLLLLEGLYQQPSPFLTWSQRAGSGENWPGGHGMPGG